MRDGEPLICLLCEPGNGGRQCPNFLLDSLLVYERLLHSTVHRLHHQLRRTRRLLDRVLLRLLCYDQSLPLSSDWENREISIRGLLVIDSPARSRSLRELWWWSWTNWSRASSRPPGSDSGDKKDDDDATPPCASGREACEYMLIRVSTKNGAVGKHFNVFRLWADPVRFSDGFGSGVRWAGLVITHSLVRDLTCDDWCVMLNNWSEL